MSDPNGKGPGADVAGIAADLATSMPEPQEHAIAASQAADAAQGAQDAPPAPAADAAAPYGYKRDGTPRKSPRGRRPASELRPAARKPASSTAPAPAPQPDPSAVQELECAKAGAATAATIFMLCQSLGGEEWVPARDPATGIDEREMMCAAWKEYYMAAGVVSVPPWVGIAMVSVTYAGRRLAMPKTQTRLQRLKVWAFAKWNQWQGKRNANAARPDSRPDGKRENDTREAALPGVSAARH